MAQKTKDKTPSFLAGRSTARGGAGVNFGTAQQVEEEIESLDHIDLSRVPRTSLDLIDQNPFQRRRKMNDKKLAELKKDMKRNGITSVILGRMIDGRVQIAYGHRRVEATRQLNAEGLAGFEGYPVVFKDLTDDEMRLYMHGENRYREDLSPLDLADQYQDYMAAGHTQVEAAAFFDVSRGTLREHLDLLEDPQDIQDLVEEVPNVIRAIRDLRKVADPEIRAQVIADLRQGDITGTQVPIHIETLQREKENHRQQAASVIEIEEAREFQQPSPMPQSIAHDGSNGANKIGHETVAPITAMPTSAPAKLVTATSSRKAPADREELLQETRQRDTERLQLSRLKTVLNNLQTYGKTTEERMGDGATIPEEEAGVLQDIEELASEIRQKIHG